MNNKSLLKENFGLYDEDEEWIEEMIDNDVLTNDKYTLQILSELLDLCQGGWQGWLTPFDNDNLEFIKV